jgi:hypothetical protein
MDRDESQVPTSLQIARHLLTREAVPGQEGEPTTVAESLRQTCVHVCDQLRDSMGEDGCSALLARALARTEADHPALKHLRRLNGPGVQLDGVAASVEAHGAAATTAAIEALLAALVELLSRLIGEELAMRLLEVDPSRPRPGGEAHAP